MEESVAHFLKRHHVQVKGKTFLVGVSGGPDSIALLHLLSKYRKREGYHVEAIVVDHLLREEAKRDVEYVTKMCERWIIPVTSVQVDVTKHAKANKMGIQLAARKLRYEAFAEKMREINADYLVLGHHGDDQVETLVMNMGRAANSSSLIGIPFQRPFSGGMIIRPLLSVSKDEIHAYCLSHRLNPRMDASNEDTSYTRNNIRKNVIPLLKEKNNLVHLTGQYLNETLIEDESLLMATAREVFEQIVFINDKENVVTMKITDVLDVEKPLQRRLFRLILDYLYCHDLPNSLTYKHEGSFLQIVTSQQNKVIDLPQNLKLEKSYHQLLLYFDDGKGTDEYFKKEIHEIPSTILLPNGNQLKVSYAEDLSERDLFSFIYPMNQQYLPFIIRQRQSGDKMKYRGLHGTKKVKDILIDEKIPRQRREETYILTNSKDDILWLVGIRKSEVKLENKGEPYMLFTYKSKNNKM